MAVDSPAIPLDVDQASAIPFRWSEQGLEFCLITATGKPNKWGVPKGLIDPGETPLETAIKEAWEEAGLRGELWVDPVGHYRYRKSGRLLSVVVFLMEVHLCEKRWAESNRRKRRWVAANQIAPLVGHGKLYPFFHSAIDRLRQHSGLLLLDSTPEIPTNLHAEGR